MRPSPSRRVLAVDPTSRGFGFVVLEGDRRLVDWGLKSIRRNKEEATLVAIADLIALNAPDVLVLEDYEDSGCRRRERLRRLIRLVEVLAGEKNVTVRLVSMAHVRRYFAARGARTKHEIAGVLVERFPELKRHRPKFRKAWMSEDERQAIFDAVALALPISSMNRSVR